MKPIRLAAVPVPGRSEMTERISMFVPDHLRVAGRAGAEEHKRRIVAARCLVRPGIYTGVDLVLAVKIMPPFLFPADQEP